MRLIQTILEFSEAMQSAHSVEEADDLLGKKVAEFGVPQFTYIGAHVPAAPTRQQPVVPYYKTNFPPDWVAHYVATDALQYDPVVETAILNRRPVVWPDTGMVKTRKQRNFMGLGAEHGIASGIFIPVYGADGEMSFLGTASDRRMSNGLLKDLAWATPPLHLLAIHHHTRLSELFNAERRAVIKLSEREVEILLWAARGKTAWETSEILRIQEDTVEKHLRKAREKLGVFNTTNAVVKAIMLGLIRP